MSICFAPMVSLFLSLHLFLPKRPRNKKSPSPIVNTSIPHAQVHRCNRVCIRYEKSDLSVCRFLHPIKNHTVIPTGVITTTRKRRDRTGWGQPIRLPPFWEGNASFIRISVVHVYTLARENIFQYLFILRWNRIRIFFFFSQWKVCKIWWNFFFVIICSILSFQEDLVSLKNQHFSYSLLILLIGEILIINFNFNF